ncbi:LysR substrate-binding domain-containing protein [Leeia aquatica]|uniref:LysR family transcriptional regulator n=1 Tax=Leeia aquatica TaxID=2725557 RepID=A0A847RYR8_9NEIS|nr:LysR substrate-binding domain-containing protein [Leeia aquatica]NLR74851.1 LysR family transcriptional regulator [Leeia aquatica]
MNRSLAGLPAVSQSDSLCAQALKFGGYVQGPPLTAIRVFVVAAESGGFQQAGRQLHLSAGAVAHQVRQLELWLGSALFERLPRGVMLTEAGSQLASQWRPLLSQLEAVAQQHREQQGASHQVSLTLVPSLASSWLMPRLEDFRRQHPRIELNLLASIPSEDLQREGIDIAIRLGTGPWPALAHEPLMPEWYLAVAPPALLRSLSLQQTESWPLLFDRFESRLPEQLDWPRWFALQQLPEGRRLGSTFSHTYLTLEAARHGQGVAIAPLPHLLDDLQSGRLQALPYPALCGPYAYHLLWRKEVAHRPAVQAVCDWLRQQARACQTPPAIQEGLCG